jgi:hypothetical protein
VQWIQGIGSAQAAAPQARLMATVISGILNQRLPWRLVLLGVFLVLAVELLGIRSLAFAVGSYLSIATTMAIFAGGMIRWLAEQGAEKKSEAESEVSPGLAVCERTDCGRRSIRVAGDRNHVAAGFRTRNQGAALDGGGFPAAVAARTYSRSGRSSCRSGVTLPGWVW